VPLTDTQRRRAREFALIECAMGKPYDLAALGESAFRHPAYDTNAYMCSEFAQAVHVAAGYCNDACKAAFPWDLPDMLKGTVVQFKPFVENEAV